MTRFIVNVAGLLFISAFSWSCKSDEDAVKQAENDLFAIHDDLMPKMDDVMKLRKQLNQRISSLDSLQTGGSAVGTLRTDEEKEQAKLLSRNLTNADSLMMDWMNRYNGDTLAKLSPDNALRYLSEQNDQITDVKTKFNTSIDQARRFLDKK